MKAERGSSIMRVNLARSESEDWAEDQEEIVKDLSKQARKRCRRFLKICDCHGKMLRFVDVGPVSVSRFEPAEPYIIPGDVW